MAVSGAGAVGAANNTNRTGGLPVTGSSSGSKPQQMDFMKLIVAQLKNQNPMDPGSGNDSLPMMLQIESLNQLTKLNSSIGDLQLLSETGYASSLLGKNVTGVGETGTAITGSVTGLKMDATGVMLELGGGKTLHLADVVKVEQ